MCDTADKLNMISIEDMYNRAMAIKKCSVIYYDDLMNDKERAVWHTLSKIQKGLGVILPFNLMIARNGVDRRIVPSIKLNDDRIFIYPNR
ncbi:hypothetical protein F9B77_03925 [Staphylococcus epidermidis]|mgnify:FL=1|uniref:Uncharacterized protein n=4 Tax=Staphylococcus TaxID=1279 RepID=A0A7Z1N140_STAHA|nr:MULTISPECIES: hypothetical protein [Staphylococcus]MDU2098384.1 hypothetical protein [Staphylococcus sp.]AKC76794.1 hypothetical protein ShL2_01938 [Staphylococcus haemolyticus]KAB2158436.1 hypothetical protein F9B18_05235 [Staphylococcus epidermidis]KAB2231135.1 hypothetical protein F9B34_08100 [Staphylococcus epidermidis]KAB2235143.1 hypothetical protein F9B28_02830 [Staphylococcus epidermidis]